jgi:hypothetical protein
VGKWYYGVDAEAYRSHPAFREMERHHQLVHISGTNAAEAFTADRLDEALDHIEAVEKASVDLMRCLDDLDGS